MPIAWGLSDWKVLSRDVADGWTGIPQVRIFCYLSNSNGNLQFSINVMMIMIYEGKHDDKRNE